MMYEYYNDEEEDIDEYYVDDDIKYDADGIYADECDDSDDDCDKDEAEDDDNSGCCDGEDYIPIYVHPSTDLRSCPLLRSSRRRRCCHSYTDSHYPSIA